MPSPKSPDGLKITVPGFLSRLRPIHGEDDPVMGQARGPDGGAVGHISVVERWGLTTDEQPEKYRDVLYISRPARWKRLVTFGIALDSWAKFFLTVNMFVAGFGFTFGIGELILRRNNNATTSEWKKALGIIYLTWGIFFSCATIVGLMIMWGRWRKSTTVVHIYTLASAFFVILYLMAACLWFYFATFIVAKVERGCRKAANNLETTGNFSENVKFFYDTCYKTSNVTFLLTWNLIWGFIGVAQTYFGAIFVLWGRDYERRLRLEEASKGMRGLVMVNENLERGSWMEKDAISIASPADFDTPYTVVAESTPVMVPIKPANARIVTIAGGGSIGSGGPGVNLIDIPAVPALPPLPPPAMYAYERNASRSSLASRSTYRT